MGMIIAGFFYLQVTPTLPIETICLSVKEKNCQIDFQNGGCVGHGLLIEMMLATFYHQFTPIVSTIMDFRSKCC